jgi:integrase/recombinase XerD
MKQSQAITGWLITLSAEGYSPRTIELYTQQLARFTEWAKDPPVEDVTTLQLRQYLNWLRDDYKTTRGKPLSRKTVYNNWIALRSFFGWCHKDHLLSENPSLAVSSPKYTSLPPDPFTLEEVEALLSACKQHTRDALRNQTIIVLLVDTGMRASELLGIEYPNDIDLKRQRVRVTGKGDKQRALSFGNNCRRYLWRFLTERGEDKGPLILSERGGGLSLNALEQLFLSLGKWTGISPCYPHRLRHTFAVNFLKNGGNAIALQEILGHTSLDMVRRYVHLAQRDVEEIHRSASPVDRWQL